MPTWSLKLYEVANREFAGKGGRMHLKEVLWVAMGGALGSSARFLLSSFVLHHTMHHKFPYGTFAVNVIGCLLAGVLVGVSQKHELISTEVRLLFLTGILGGFTTFSAFGVETHFLLRRGEVLLAFSYIALSLLCGFAALAIAYWLVPGGSR
jgi:CrcB protein